MTSHEPSALTGAYVLDALDPAERELFEAHLAGCADCAAEVAGLRAAAAELSHVTATAPPPALRTDLLAAIERVRPLPPPGGAVPLPVPRRRQSWAWQAVAAACVVIAAAAVVWGFQQRRSADLHTTRAAAITALLANPDTRIATGRLGAGHASLVYSKDGHTVLLIGTDVAAPPGDKTYQLWMISAAGAPTSAGIFTPDRHGNVLVQARGNLTGVARMGVSVEPAGGSRVPTPGAIIAVMPI
jgi:anti-sigma-K factor RskA